MSTITGKPIFPHSYTLYVSGTNAINLSDNTHNVVIQVDANSLVINLPNSSSMIDSANLTFSAGNGGQLTITASSGDSVEGVSSCVVTSQGSCLLSLQKETKTWNIIYNIGGPSPLPVSTQIIYVDNGGSDSVGVGDGSINHPYATITYAMSTITDALWEKRYVIYVGPGNWPDNFHWKAWVYVVGSTNGNVRLTGTIDINDPSWAVAGSHSDERAGAQNISFTGTFTIDFTQAPSSYGKFYFWNCNMNNVLTATGYHPVNQIYIFGGQWFSGITYSGINLTINANVFFSGPITCNPSSVAAVFTAISGTLQGNLILDSTGGTTVTGGLYDYFIEGTITITGASTTLEATSSSLPIMSAIAISSGATLSRLNDAYGLSYTPTTPTDWNGNPTSLQNAIDRMASLLKTLNGGVPIP